MVLAKNLVIVVQPNTQFYDPCDFIDIADRIMIKAPDIRTYLVSATAKFSEIDEEIARAPTLIVSFNQKPVSRPLRGRVVYNKPIDKLEQADILERAGVSVPHGAIFKPGMTFDPALWGDFVLLKPALLELTSRGDNVHLYRSQRLAAMKMADFPEEHAIHRMPMIVQRFIDTGRFPCKYRALTLFGEVLYVQRVALVSPRPDLASADEIIESALIATSGAEREHRHKHWPDVAAIAKITAAALSDVPLLGVDIVREVNTNKLYVLESNAGGNVWHFSSQHWAERRTLYPDIVRRMREQYSAFDTAARALISATRRLAL